VNDTRSSQRGAARGIILAPMVSASSSRPSDNREPPRLLWLGGVLFGLAPRLGTPESRLVHTFVGAANKSPLIETSRHGPAIRGPPAAWACRAYGGPRCPASRCWYRGSCSPEHLWQPLLTHVIRVPRVHGHWSAERPRRLIRCTAVPVAVAPAVLNPPAPSETGFGGNLPAAQASVTLLPVSRARQDRRGLGLKGLSADFAQKLTTKVLNPNP
jgi:hypothetical protein